MNGRRIIAAATGTVAGVALGLGGTAIAHAVTHHGPTYCYTITIKRHEGTELRPVVKMCGANSSAYPTNATVARDVRVISGIPRWLRVRSTDQVSDDQPCVIVYGPGKHGTSATVCKDGVAVVSGTNQH